jgi:hypothetical protein
MELDEIKKMLPEGVSLAELLPFLRKDERAIKTYLQDGPVWHELTKTCSRCGAQFKGKQKVFVGYEGNWMNKELAICYLCIPKTFDNLKEQFLTSLNFDLEQVIEPS